MAKAAHKFPVRRFEVTHYDRTLAYLVEPTAYRCPEIAAELADLFLPVHAEVPGSVRAVVGGIRDFVRWISEEVDPVPRSLVEVTATHVHGWERSLRNRQQNHPSHVHYEKFVCLRALLLRISQDEPNRIHPTLHHLLASPVVTVLAEMRSVEGLAPFAAEVHRHMIYSAYRDVARGLRLAAKGQIKQLGKDMPTILTALHVLLSIGTGEPPEVLRNVRLSDIRPLVPAAETVAPRHKERAAWLQDVALSRPSGYCVQLRKLRAHTLYDTFVTRRDRHSCFALEASLLLTAPFRIPGGSDAMWVDKLGRHAVFEDRSRLSQWICTHGIDVDGPVAFARFRKTVVGAEAMADPAAYLAMARRHRAPTFFRSYVNNPVLRSHSGRVLIGAIESAFEQAIQPTVITPEDMKHLVNGSPSDYLRLDADEQRILLAGEMEGPHAACRAPKQSPFDRAGDVCGSSASGLCFVCPNAVITERHLPALVFFADRLHPSRAGDIEAWKLTWEPVWTAITRGILPRFDNTLIEQAQLRVDTVFVDIGVRQDLAALEVDP